MKTVLLLNDTAGHGNWGSAACIEGFRKILQESDPGIAFRSFPHELMVRQLAWHPKIFGRKLFDQHNPWMRKLAGQYRLVPAVADEFDFVKGEWLAGRGGPGADRFIDLMKGVDAVVFNAEGSTYRANYAAVSAIFMLWLAVTHYKTPGFFLNGSVTLGPTDPILPGMLRKTFPLLAGIAVREPCSLRHVKEYVPEARAEMVPDSVFHFQPEDAARNSAAVAELKSRIGGSPYFCFSLSMLPVDFRRTRGKSALCAAIARLRKQTPAAVLMARDDEDLFLRDVAAETGAAFFGPQRTFREVMALLEDAQFLFTGRYHHAIMAAIMGCPVIPMVTTSHKMDGLCELLAVPECRTVDPTDLWSAVDAVDAVARQILAGGRKLRGQYQTRSVELHSATRRLGSILKSRV